ncbi:Rft-1-domain-containing protein [Hyaloscypha variabilis F]|uniref:Man(5)GlcNAc(2)-PP-dolichol translocation protein RFT1 n=1 Tax=Hyaloscypha variabilis (strain UAMH 11265 / GT02V1 / F) TaxID=1149755 RepID=A0A2J6S0H9_HYAVF|nr:Rft-1-domain-containing protein [Hyaloscypha variabilis F]
MPAKSESAGVAGKSPAISRSAIGAALLISLQFSSRILTFVVNQVLLRYLSPELLGISTQLELYSITVLFFARESLRIAIQRQADTKDDDFENSDKSDRSHVDARTAAGRSQAIVNLAYISIGLGAVFASGFAWLYLHTTPAQNPFVLETPYVRESLFIYGFAAIGELLAEPCYVIAQQKARFEVRASAESTATVLRCLMTCGCAILASRMGRDIGVLPFALGQGIYALSLTIVYYWKFRTTSSTSGFSLIPTRISSDSTLYIFSYFSWPLLSLSGTFFVQSIVKHFLTQGDTLIITSLASPRAQGMYALASNYGGLIARLLLQPVEEVSRNHFGKALSAVTGISSKEVVLTTRDQLLRLLRVYVLLSICIVTVGPTTAPLILKAIAGSRWSSSGAGSVLSTYCYYIPLLAINGLTEAFVSSVATEPELHRQTIWMIGFSIAFAGAAFTCLQVLDLGAKGLVWANGANMLCRILWCTAFIKTYLKRHGAGLDSEFLIPRPITIAAAAVTYAVLVQLHSTFNDGILDYLESGVVAVVFITVL